MYALLLTAILADPWIESDAFPRAVQEKAFSATLRLKVGPNEGTAVRVGRLGKATYYLTAAHVVGKEKAVNLEAFDPKTAKVSQTIELADVKIVDVARDLALLVAGEKEPGPSLPILGKGVPATQFPFAVMSVGCDHGQSPMIWLDIARFPRKAAGEDVVFWPVGKKSVLGRSGGPLVSQNGDLIGICKGNNGQDAYYVHINEIRKFLDIHAFNGLYEPPALNLPENQKKPMEVGK